MQQSILKSASWLAGIAGVVAIVVYFQPEGFASTFTSLGWQGAIVWIGMTLIARLALVETTVVPLGALGFRLSRSDAFWIGWVRTFANQVVPVSGIAAYAQLLRRRVAISWSELAALAAPQLVLALAALGVIGLLAIAVNLARLQPALYVLALLYLSMTVLSILMASGAAGLIESLPTAVAKRAQDAATALRKLARHPGLIARVVAFHGTAILFRGARIWALFLAAGMTPDWRDMLLLIAIAESSMLINVTPGGLGIREVLVMSGSALVGIPASVSVSVALVDRVLVLAVTTLFAIPAVAYLRHENSS